MIKPGSVCYLAGITALTKKKYNGRVVTVTRPCSFCEFPCWQVDAPWLLGYRYICAAQRNLIPINDPDEPVTTRTPEEITA